MNCQTCGNEGTLVVSDTQEMKPGLFVPVGKRGGCAAHPPVGLKTSLGGEMQLVAPPGYTINQYGVLIKG